MTAKPAMPSPSEFIEQTSREFGVYVNENRGIPRATDGQKDAGRKAMWAMRSRGKIKVQALAGALVEQQLYVHGDASGSVNSLAGPFTNNIPLLSPHGNFGHRLAPNAYGAARYTYVSRPSYSEELFYTDSRIIPMEENFDGSNVQPSTFLPILPMLLVNGASGIGVGWSTRILPRDPADVARAVEDILKGSKVRLPKPNFVWSTSKSEFVRYHPNGGATWRFQGSVELKNTSTIVVTELPPDMELERFKERLVTMQEDKLIRDFVDESSDRVFITIHLYKGHAKGWSEEEAVKFLRLESTITETMVMIGWDHESIIQYIHEGDVDPIEKFLRDWVDWRFKWYLTRFEELLSADSAALARLYLIRACHKAKLPSQLSSLKGKADLEDRVIAISKKAHLTLVDEDIQYVVGLPSYRWTGESVKDVEQKITELESQCKDHQAHIKDESKRRKVFQAEVQASVKVSQKAMDQLQKERVS